MSDQKPLNVTRIDIQLYGAEDGGKVYIHSKTPSGNPATSVVVTTLDAALEEVERMLGDVFETRERSLTKLRDSLVERLTTTQNALKG
jgi:hypothetical protein